MRPSAPPSRVLWARGWSTWFADRPRKRSENRRLAWRSHICSWGLRGLGRGTVGRRAGDLPMTGLRSDFVTIIARNYVPAARVLARSLARHHPASLLYVITIDADLAADFATLDNVRTIAIDDIGLPDLGVMALRYEILEFCTAIKPFALSHLLERLQGDALVYLDPDIHVLSPMSELLDALHSSSIVLTPHLLGAVDDAALPGEVEVLKTGTYNLGFLALRADAASRALLAWWSERLFDRCLNDASSGYFVDQRWMELAPSLFDGVRILREPGYNVAYWNLHERMIVEAADGYAVCGRPVRFFHFSGFSPAARGVLSRHQTRHDARDYPNLLGLLDDYAEALVAEGHPAYAEAPYRFARLANGARVSTPVRRALRVLIDRGLAFPDPHADSDAFCAMLCSPILASIDGPVSPLEWGVKAAGLKPEGGYPGVGSNSPHDAFLAWCRSETGTRLGLPSVTIRVVSTLAAEREVDRVLDAIDDERPLEQFLGLIVDRDAYQAMIYWAKAFGVARGRWTEAAVAALDALWPQMRRLFNQCAEEPFALDVMKKAGEGAFAGAWIVGGYPKPWLTKELESALGKIETLFAQDLFPSALTDAATIVLPSCSWAERSGTFINAQDKVQPFEAAIAPIEGGQSDGHYLHAIWGGQGLYQAAKVRGAMAKSMPAFASVHVPPAMPEHAH